MFSLSLTNRQTIRPRIMLCSRAIKGSIPYTFNHLLSLIPVIIGIKRTNAPPTPIAHPTGIARWPNGRQVNREPRYIGRGTHSLPNPFLVGWCAVSPKATSVMGGGDKGSAACALTLKVSLFPEGRKAACAARPLIPCAPGPYSALRPPCTVILCFF